MRYLKQKIIDVSLEVGTLVVIEILMVFDTVVYGLLRLSPGQRNVALLQEGSDVPSSNLSLRVQFVLYLTKSLCSEAQLGLGGGIA